MAHKGQKLLWAWSCSWDVGHGKDREVCWAGAKKGFKTKEAAEAAGKKHLNKTWHTYPYSNLQPSIHVYKDWFPRKK